MKTLRVEYTSFSETPIPHIEEALNISWEDIVGWRVLRNVLFVDVLDGRKLAHPLKPLSEDDSTLFDNVYYDIKRLADFWA